MDAFFVCKYVCRVFHCEERNANGEGHRCVRPVFAGGVF